MKKTATLLLASLFSAAGFSQSKGLHFDGTNDHVRIEEKSSVLTGNVMTFEAWIKPSNLNNMNSYIVNKGDDGYGWFSLNIMNDSEYGTELSAFISSETSFRQLTHTISTAWINQWHHVALTANGTTFTMYVDGTPVQSGSFNSNVPLNDQALYLGTSSNWGNDAFAGTMDEVRIWNVARTQSQIQASKNTEVSPTTTGLTAYYRLNDGTLNGNNTNINSVVDLVPSGNNGALLNFARNGSSSNFTTGYLLATLPIREGSFSATKKENSVQVSWKAMPDVHAQTFEVERSNNGVAFAKIGAVEGAAINAETSYSFIDVRPGAPVVHYRLKTVSANGQFAYSKVVVVRMADNALALQVYPNPAQNTVHLQLSVPAGIIPVEMKDASGRTIKAFTVQSTGMPVSTSIDVSRLAKGTYLLSAGQSTKIFVKQ